ncbi:hypothetical protein FACS189452_01220 [Bacteroidia bacterium]|nr:hypothetical protein FACS189452_01220 [Bacteroidia bacterium]
MDDDYEDFFEDDADFDALLQRYEDMLRGGQRCYLESEDFEEIIDYYMHNAAFAKALQAVDVALEQYPDDEDILLAQSFIFVSTQRYDEAMKVVQRLEKFAESNDIEVMHIKAMILIAQGHVKEGVSLIDKVLKYCPDDDDKVHFLSLGIDSLRDAKAYSDALHYALQLQLLVPNDMEAALILARCYKDNGDVKDSLAAYKSCLELEPTDEDDIWLELGDLHEQYNQPDKAMKAYNQAIGINPDNIQGYWKKAALYANSNQQKEVEKVHSALLKRFPDFVPGWYTKGRCYVDMHKKKPAMECFCKAIELDPYFSDAYYGMALVMMTEKKSNKQIEFLQRALALNPYNPTYYMCISQGYMQKAQPQKAAQALEHCLLINANFLPAWILLSDVHSIRSYATAIATLKRALQHLPNDMRIICQLAVMYYKNKDFADCWEQLECVWKGNPTDALWFFQECPDAVANTMFLKMLKSKK